MSGKLRETQLELDSREQRNDEFLYIQKVQKRGMVFVPEVYDAIRILPSLILLMFVLTSLPTCLLDGLHYVTGKQLQAQGCAPSLTIEGERTPSAEKPIKSEV